MLRAGYVFNHAEIIGGGEISFIDLITAIRAKDVDPVAFVPGPGEVGSRLEDAGIETVEAALPRIRPRSLAAAWRARDRLGRLFSELGLDLVHANGARCMLYAGSAARSAGVPCVWHVRVLERDWVLDRARSRLASAIVANSRAVADSLARLTGRRDEIEVIYNGFGLDGLEEAIALDPEDEFGVPRGPIVLGVGRFSRWKRFEDLIRAHGLVTRRSIESSLILAGAALPEERDYELELRDLARRLEPADVVFCGWHDDVPALMKAADVLVLPSADEPFGRVIVEAWACGLPVVATASGGPAEIIEPGETGILVDQGDLEGLAEAIAAVLTDPALAQRLAAGGRARAKDFTIERHADEILGLYRHLVPPASTKPARA